MLQPSTISATQKLRFRIRVMIGAFVLLGFCAITGNAQSTSSDTVNKLSQEIQASQARINALQKQLDSQQAGADFQKQLDAEREHLASMQAQLDSVGTPAPKKIKADDIYNNGFTVSTEDKSFSLTANGLFQMRYTGFKPSDSVAALGESSQGTNNFDVYLGRLALSGSVFKPELKYFLQFQGSTAGNSNTVTMLDWFISDTISKHLTLQAGRSWTPYSYEYYDNPGNYLLPDLSTAEYAFALPRAIGVQAYGDAGRASYAVMVANSIPALDASGQENFDSKLAYIGHFQYNLLAPYGYVESDPAGASKAVLTFWASGAYNPVAASSGFENVTKGDTTVNATSTVGYRYKYFTLQTTGYYRKTTPVTGAAPNNSWGYSEQAGIYLIPHKLELAQRLSGVNWGAADYGAGSIPTTPLPVENVWFVGPGFSYHRVAEDTAGLNYYLHGHNAKLQMAYSYLHGNTFDAKTFSANRAWVQAQIMF